MKTLTGSLLVLALAGTASAQAQTQTQCCTDSIPLQSTNWAGSVSIPKFNPNLGTLQSITYTLTGRVEGSTRVESLDAAPSLVTTSLQADITLTRPDLTVLVVTTPLAQFVDNFTAFDGVIDFDGTSGEARLNIVTQDQDQAVSPPPVSDLALFTGAGNIVLPIAASGASTAVGSGNLITQFLTQAAATVEVCYTYLPNTPPVLSCPGPLMASVGVPLQFQICASDPDANELVTLDVQNAPPGMTFNPPLPVVGNPACVTATWTPGPTQVGDFVLTFSGIDTHQRSSTCTVNILSAECHLLVSSGPGNSSATVFGHLYDTQLLGVRRSFPVTMVDMPSFSWQQLPQTITLQLVMYNPNMFPSNPDQYSQALRVTKVGYGVLQNEYFGVRDGITLNSQVFWVNGQPRVRFPFTIDGM